MMHRLIDALTRVSRRYVWAVGAIAVVLVLLAINARTGGVDTPAAPAPTVTPTVPVTTTAPATTYPTTPAPSTTPTQNPDTEPDRNGKAATAAVTGWVNTWLAGRRDGAGWRDRLERYSTSYLMSLYENYDRSLIPATTLRSVDAIVMSSTYGRLTAVLADRTRLVCSVVLGPGGRWRVFSVVPA
jgi:hypothetical protein